MTEATTEWHTKTIIRTEQLSEAAGFLRICIPYEPICKDRRIFAFSWNTNAALRKFFPEPPRFSDRTETQKWTQNEEILVTSSEKIKSKRAIQKNTYLDHNLAKKEIFYNNIHHKTTLTIGFLLLSWEGEFPDSWPSFT